MQHEALRATPLLGTLLDSFPEPAMVVNARRQIVMANDKLGELLGHGVDEILGRRPGEALDCIRWREGEGGCGTSEACRYCGAVLALLNSQRTGKRDVQECRITRQADGEECALDLRIWATPFVIGEGRHTIFAVRDITDEKRRPVLERMFFHDALNTAGGLQGMSRLLLESEGEELRGLVREVLSLCEQLVEEIGARRDLAAAERGDLRVDLEQVDAEEVLASLGSTYTHHPVARGRTIRVEDPVGEPTFRSDRRLLVRVLGNLLKNALEASEPGQTVTVSYCNDERPVFRVHNETAMPPAAQLQVFQRSFSTKQGPGRGVGAYSAKLLTERYLGGSLAFVSSEEGGTTFEVALPAK